MATMIEVNNLGKKYRLGGQDKYYKTLRESLMRGIKRPFQWLAGSAPQEEEFWALRNATFSVEEGEVVGIIGRNGAGKSTLLRLLSRITRPTEGSAKLYGRVGSLLEVGTGFHPELTGRENIYLSGNLLGMTRAEVKARYDEIVDFSGVEKFLETPVKHFSTGMYVRLGFAIAAHLEPEILLVDEVLAVGDAQFQKKCLGKMDAISTSGKSILFVSHNMRAIQRVCQRAILLDSGGISDSGDVGALVRRYTGGGQSQASLRIPSVPGSPASLSLIVSEDAEGRGRNRIRSEESWRVRVRFRVQRQLTGCVCRILLHTGSGVALRIDSTTPTDLEPGEYQVLFPIDLPLRSHLFWVGVELGTPLGSLQSLPDAISVVIDDESRDDMPIRSTMDPLLRSTCDVAITAVDDEPVISGCPEDPGEEC